MYRYTHIVFYISLFARFSTHKHHNHSEYPKSKEFKNKKSIKITAKQLCILPSSVTTKRSVSLSPLKSPKAATYPFTTEIPTLSVTSLNAEDTGLQNKTKKAKQNGICIASYLRCVEQFNFFH